MIAQRGLDLLGGGEQDHRLRRDQVERSSEVLKRQQVGQIRERLALLSRLKSRQLGQFAVLCVELRRGRKLDPIGLPEASAG